MRISLNWLKEFIHIDVSLERLTEIMTMLGMEHEETRHVGAGIKGVVVGRILSIKPHPDADRLVVCKTDVGEAEPLQIVCGATNMREGDKVPTATVGAALPGGFEIGRRKMRGLESFGMMCSPKELGLGNEHEGLMILDPGLPIGADIKPILGLDDAIIEIEVTPNRGDWASMVGVARELAAYLQTEITLPEATVEETENGADEVSSVTIDAPGLCHRYLGRILTGIKVGPSPQWMAQRLLAAGMRPVNNIVDITNYVMLETGHPLHAFDLDKLTEKRVIVRRAKAGEKITAIDHVERTLDESMLVIADTEKPVAVAGVMGGMESEVSEATTSIFLESAVFAPASIRRTSRTLGLISESSQRFQRGTDPENALLALNRAARLMHAYADGTVRKGIIDEFPTPPTSIPVALRPSRTNKILGTIIEPERQFEFLRRLGFTENNGGDSRSFTAPAWRHDVSCEEDLIEEIARLHGFDNIEPTLPRVRPSGVEISPRENQIQRLRHALARMGLTEVMTMTFCSSQDLERAEMAEALQKAVSLENPISELYALMRTSMIPGMLNAISRNIRKGSPNLRMFEIGPVYSTSSDALPEQSTRLAIALTGDATDSHWSREARPIDFHDLRGYLESLSEELRFSVSIQNATHDLCSQTVSATILTPNGPLGLAGKLSEKVAARFDIEQDVYLLELDLEKMLDVPARRVRFSAVPAFPPSSRDLAVVVSKDAPAGDLQVLAMATGGKFLKKADIFDIYTGSQVTAGKKSVALRLVFQSPDRTLTDKDTQKAFDAILRALEKQYEAQLR